MLQEEIYGSSELKRAMEKFQTISGCISFQGGPCCHERYLRPPTVLGLGENDFLWAIHWKILLQLSLDAPLKLRQP